MLRIKSCYRHWWAYADRLYAQGCLSPRPPQRSMSHPPSHLPLGALLYVRAKEISSFQRLTKRSSQEGKANRNPLVLNRLEGWKWVGCVNGRLLKRPTGQGPDEGLIWVGRCSGRGVADGRRLWTAARGSRAMLWPCSDDTTVQLYGFSYLAFELEKLYFLNLSFRSLNVSKFTQILP